MKKMRYIFPAGIAVIALCIGWIAYADTEKTDNNPPARLAGHARCSNFIQAWSDGGDSFKKDPPNAVLSACVPNAEPTKIVVTLENPRFEGQNLIYDTKILKGTALEGMHEAALFIENSRWPGGNDPSCFPKGLGCTANG